MQLITSVVEVCRKLGILTSICYNWKRDAERGMRDAVSGPSGEVVALKQENAGLRKLVAGQGSVMYKL
ncbi:MAG: transposase [Thermoplasmatales archaeon]|nr:transposase [Thermoplasmatales archaeon]